MEGSGGRSLIELSLPLAEHLVDLFLENGDIGGAALLAGRLEVGELLLEVVHPVAGLVLEQLVRRRLATLPHGGDSIDRAGIGTLDLGIEGGSRTTSGRRGTTKKRI